MEYLLVTLEYPPQRGGVANYYANLVANWPQDKLAVLDNSSEKLLSPHFYPHWFRALKTVASYLRSKKADYLIAGQILPIGTVLYFLSYLFHFRYAVVFHGMDLSLALSGRKKFLSKAICRRADKIICANTYTANLLKESWPNLASKVSVVNPGVEVPSELLRQAVEIKDKPEFIKGKKILLSLGRLVRRKGIDKTLAALALLAKEHSSEEWYQKIVYVIVGAGPEEAYLKAEVSRFTQELAAIDPDFSKKVVFLGAINEEEKWFWLKNCDILVMPSRNISGDFEGFGIVYLEANLMAKPVIAGASGGVSDAVINNETGLLINPEEEGAIALAIESLVKDEKLSSSLGQEGRRVAQEKFSWRQQAEKFYQALS